MYITYIAIPIYYVVIAIILIMTKSTQCTGYATMHSNINCVILIVELQTLCG